MTVVNTVVKSVMYDWFRNYHCINGNMRVTYEHRLFVKRGGTWAWTTAANVRVGDFFLSKDGMEIMVLSNELVEMPLAVVNINVEDCDTYFVGGINDTFIIAHNVEEANQKN